MKLYHIVAAASGNVIGKNNQLPWPKLSADLKRFKAITLGNTVIMGRKTFQSIGSKPLLGRENFVLSRGAELKDVLNLKFFSLIEDALRAVKTEKVFIIGGAEIFKQTIEQVDGIYFTNIKKQYSGDTCYPQIPKFFKEVSKEISSEDPSVEFIFYENAKKKVAHRQLS